MAWNGSGVFTRTNNQFSGADVWAQDDNSAIDILAVRHDLHDQDLALGINNALAKDGQNAMTGNLDLGTNQINNGNALLSQVSVTNGSVEWAMSQPDNDTINLTIAGSGVTEFSFGSPGAVPEMRINNNVVWHTGNFNPASSGAISAGRTTDGTALLANHGAHVDEELRVTLPVGNYDVDIFLILNATGTIFWTSGDGTAVKNNRALNLEATAFDTGSTSDFPDEVGHGGRIFNDTLAGQVDVPVGANRIYMRMQGVMEVTTAGTWAPGFNVDASSTLQILRGSRVRAFTI